MRSLVHAAAPPFFGLYFFLELRIMKARQQGRAEPQARKEARMPEHSAEARPEPETESPNITPEGSVNIPEKQSGDGNGHRVVVEFEEPQEVALPLSVAPGLMKSYRPYLERAIAESRRRRARTS
jgi:hypothetical protein